MDVIVAGVGMSNFGMFTDVSTRQLVATATTAALADAGVTAADVGLVVFGNAAAGLITGQEMIRAQTSLSTSPLAGVPTMSVENACASSSSAFHAGCLAIASDMYDVVVVVGAEKMTDTDRSRAGRALATAVDVEAQGTHAAEGSAPRPVFMEIYAAEAREYMARSGATERDLAAVAAKSTANGARNPYAQVRTAITVDDVLAARMIVAPLTRPMCSSIGDGAAALVLCSPPAARPTSSDGRPPRPTNAPASARPTSTSPRSTTLPPPPNCCSARSWASSPPATAPSSSGTASAASAVASRSIRLVDCLPAATRSAPPGPPSSPS